MNIRIRSAVGQLALMWFSVGAPILADAQTRDDRKVGFEILHVKSPNRILVWVTQALTEEEFDAIRLPLTWFKNQPREVDTDGGRFLRSPDADVDGPLVEKELFGHTWRYNAKVTKLRIPMDADRLLEAAHVAKYHEIEYWAGKTIHVLVSPADDCYLRVSRDANRSSDTPTLPEGWRLIEQELEMDLSLQLPNPTVNIRADNDDSFQGPISAEALALRPELVRSERGSPSSATHSELKALRSERLSGHGRVSLENADSLDSASITDVSSGRAKRTPLNAMRQFLRSVVSQPSDHE